MINISKILNPQAITGIFGEMPDFIGSEILELRLKRDGPTLFINLMIKQPVKTVPKRWPEKWDVIYVEFSFIGIRSLHINDWMNNNLIQRFEIIEQNEDGNLKIVCDEALVLGHFDWCRIENIKPGLLGNF